MKRIFDQYIFPVIISILLVHIMVDEYRDHGWRGVVLMLIGALALALVVFVGGFALLERWVRRSRERN